ncbi:BQ5605_C016g08228 [Microbotryum silenes-dioicae]|uniref:BQ5605_C016g08228 protein n=1 Tax=Microbotryum silenes-dioicae TaxID=796604 RepID=A0A2X0LVS5_9BASI|nr:BQ5605_C016g08228 [Microbotryum silenes-dioicae]
MFLLATLAAIPSLTVSFLSAQAFADFPFCLSCLLAIFFNLFSSSRIFSPSARRPAFSHVSFSCTFSLCSSVKVASFSLRFSRMAKAVFASLGRSWRFFLLELSLCTFEEVEPAIVVACATASCELVKSRLEKVKASAGGRSTAEEVEATKA